MTTIQATSSALISVPVPAVPAAAASNTPAAPSTPTVPAAANPLTDVLTQLDAIRNANYPEQAVKAIQQNQADFANARLSQAKQQLSSLRELLLKSGALLDPQTAAQFVRLAAGYARDIADATKTFAGSDPDSQTAESFGTNARDGLAQASSVTAEAGLIASFGDRDTHRDAANSQALVHQAIAEFNTAVGGF